MTVLRKGPDGGRGPGDTVMPLTDTHIRNAKPKAKSYKLSDGGGMYLLVKPDGARYWRLDYRFSGKRRTRALGVYSNNNALQRACSPRGSTSTIGARHRSECHKESNQTGRGARER